MSIVLALASGPTADTGALADLSDEIEAYHAAQLELTEVGALVKGLKKSLSTKIQERYVSKAHAGVPEWKWKVGTTSVFYKDAYRKLAVSNAEALVNALGVDVFNRMFTTEEETKLKKGVTLASLIACVKDGGDHALLVETKTWLTLRKGAMEERAKVSPLLTAEKLELLDHVFATTHYDVTIREGKKA